MAETPDFRSGEPQYGDPTYGATPYSQPSAPSDQPGYGQPADANYGQSQQPGYGQPSASNYGQPQQPGYGQPSAPNYGQPQQPGYGQQQPYGQQPYGQPYGYAAMDHPQSQMVFIMGILGIFTTVTAYVAWYMGAQAKKEIDAGAPYQWGGQLKTGYTLGKVFGIIWIVLWALIILFYILMFAILAGTGF